MKPRTRTQRASRIPGLTQLLGLAVMGTVFVAAEVAVRVEHSVASLADRHARPSPR